MDLLEVQRSLDSLKGHAPNGAEFWRARDIQHHLGYDRWENFEGVIRKAIMACESTGVDPDNQIRETTNLVEVGSGATYRAKDYFISRYGCYLIAMNGDPGKPEIALAQTYFAVQTRKQELLEAKTDDEEKRLLLRNRVKESNKHLRTAANVAGVQNYALFHDAGYRGLYGGIGVSDIKSKKGITPKEDLLDCAGRAELAANEFRITQTESKLSREGTKGQDAAMSVHKETGKEVRETIRRLGGTMPEDLPAEPSIKKLIATKKKVAKSLPRTEGA